MGGDAKVFGWRQRRDHDKGASKLRSRVKSLKADLLAAEDSAGREKARLQRAAEVKIEEARAAEAKLRMALTITTRIKPEVLIALESLLRREGFWGFCARARFGVRFALTKRVV